MIPRDKDPYKNNFNGIVHAAVVTSREIIKEIGRDLEEYFIKNNISLINVSPADFFGPDAITLILAGKERNIKKTLNYIRKICERFDVDIENTPIKILPPALKNYLYDLENKERFENLFKYCSKEYLAHCKSKKIKPHPEVVEGFKI